MKYRNANQGPDMLVGSKMSIDGIKNSKSDIRYDLDLSHTHLNEISKPIGSHALSFGEQGIWSERSSKNDPLIVSNEQTLTTFNRQHTLMLNNMQSSKNKHAGS